MPRKATPGDLLEYVEELEAVLLRTWSDGEATAPSIEAALDGQPYRELRRRTTLAQRRSLGAFFTGQELAGKLVTGSTAQRGLSIHDPTCGAGDLLLAVARLMPVRATLGATLAFWGKLLSGTDVDATFVRLAKARLALLAKARTGSTRCLGAENLETIFPRITRSDVLTEQLQLADTDWLLLNPPFIRVGVPRDCRWGTGSANAAAVIFDKCIQAAGDGARVSAILPEVLRTGTRYDKWRMQIAERLRKVRVSSWGRFDPQTDVDVFVLTGVVARQGRKTTPAWTPGEETRSEVITLEDLFDVSVGPVVPHRHEDTGRRHPFVAASTVPRWGLVRKPVQSRGFSGRLFGSPFVVVRRTSSPGDRERAVGAIIASPEKVAVENHLIICRPKDRTLRGCRELLADLQDPRTTRWLNQAIRCRHLTTKHLRELPMWSRS